MDSAANPMGLAHFIAHADAVARTLLLILLVMSIGTWSLIVGKGLKLWRARRAAGVFLRDFWAAPSLDAVERRITQNGVTDAFSHLVHHGFTAVAQHRAGRDGEQPRGLANAREPSLPLRRRCASPHFWLVGRIASRSMCNLLQGARRRILRRNLQLEISSKD